MHLSATWWENKDPIPLTTELKSIALLKRISFVYLLKFMKYPYIWAQSKLAHLVSSRDEAVALSSVSSRLAMNWIILPPVQVPHIQRK